MRLLVSVLLAVALAGCGTLTSVRGSWRSPEVKVPALTPLVILSATGGPAKRVTLNAALLKALVARGLQVTDGEQVVPAAIYDKDNNGRVDPDVDTAALTAFLIGKGFKTALVLKQVAVDKTSYTTPSVEKVEVRTIFDSTRNTWTQIKEKKVEAGSTFISTDYKFEVNLIELGQSKLAWQAETTTVDPSGREDLAASLAAAVVATMEKDGLIPSGH